MHSILFIPSGLSRLWTEISRVQINNNGGETYFQVQRHCRMSLTLQNPIYVVSLRSLADRISLKVHFILCKRVSFRLNLSVRCNKTVRSVVALYLLHPFHAKKPGINQRKIAYSISAVSQTRYLCSLLTRTFIHTKGLHPHIFNIFPWCSYYTQFWYYRYPFSCGIGIEKNSKQPKHWESLSCIKHSSLSLHIFSRLK